MEIAVTARTKAPKQAAITFIVLLGFVSLFGDMTYEGARSVVGPYLALLGASATVVGMAAGFGELVGYGFRLLSGYVGDRTGRYWTATIIGYILNLFAVPLLALATSWQIAVILIVAERIGRALRAATRDAMLSHAAVHTGAGWALGLHEAMDTTGAVIGPLAISTMLYLKQGYTASFALLALIARAQFPAPRDLEVAEPIREPRVLPKRFGLFSFAAAFIGAGYADFSLQAYHFGKTGAVSAPWVPLLYAAAMVAAAVAALAFGPIFDRIGIAILIPVTLVSVAPAPLAFLGGPALLTIGIICWGIGMGAQESVMRAVVVSMTTRERRGTAFGWFHTVFGVAWFISSVILGMTYDHSIADVAILSLALQLFALPVLWATIRSSAEGQTRGQTP